jgi:hypothetical protein
MKLEQAKIICNTHVEYVYNGTKNDYTPTQIGIAIDILKESIKPHNKLCYYLLDLYNQWRRGTIDIYPLEKTDLQDCIVICNKYL